MLLSLDLKQSSDCVMLVDTVQRARSEILIMVMTDACGDEALAAMDHPSGDGINSYVVSKVTRDQGITVALSGLGGDELFAGYPVFTQVGEIQGRKGIWRIPAGSPVVWFRR